MRRKGPGGVLKSLRQSKNWTLADVSQRTGVPASTLSRLENDQISPTFNQLMMISEGLEIDLASLFSSLKEDPGKNAAGRRSINLDDDGEVLELRNVTMRYLSTDMLNKKFAPVEVVVRAQSVEEAGGFMRHEGDEFLYILEGEMELFTEYYAPLILKQGHSIYFDSSMAHTYVARGGKPCRCLSVCTVRRPHAKDEETEAGEEAIRQWRAKVAAVDAMTADQ